MSNYKVIDNGTRIQISKSSLSRFALRVLEELSYTHDAEIHDEHVIIETEVIYFISENFISEDFVAESGTQDFLREKEAKICTLLGLPEPFKGPIEFQHYGSVGWENFKIIPRFSGNQVFAEGPVLYDKTNNNNLGTLPYPLYSIFQQLASIADLPELNRKTISTQRRLLCEISELRNSGLVTTDKFRDITKFLRVQGPLKLEVQHGDSGGRILPRIDDAYIEHGVQGTAIQEAFQKKFISENNSTADSMFKIRKADGSSDSYRAIFDEELESEFVALKQLQKDIEKDPSVFKRAIENPEQFFDPEFTDLDEFSSRVSGLGQFKPIKIPGMVPASLDWWGRVYFDDTEEYWDEPSPIKSLDEKEAALLSTKIQEAEAANANSIEWKNQEVAVAHAKKRLETFRSAQSQAETSSQKPQEPKLEVIATQNIEELAYEDHAEVELKDFEFHPLEQVQTVFELKNYQKSGVAWMQALYNQHATGGLLADDMGLGKTLQVLYFLSWVYETRKQTENGALRVLLVSPKTLIMNWQEEYAKFFPGQEFFFFGDESLEHYLDFTGNPNTQHLGAVKQVSYQSLQRHSLKYAKVDWDIIVADEAHNAKTPGNRITNAILALKRSFFIAMTGTPIENSYSELWNIMDYVAPGHLGSLKDFKKTYELPKDADFEKVLDISNSLKAKLGSYMLRRTKDSELAKELPTKTIHSEHIEGNPLASIHIPFTTVQEAAYHPVLERARSGLPKGMVFKELHKLRLITQHPRFLSKSEIASIPMFTEEIYKESAKIEALQLILDNVQAKGEKALVFAELKATQYMLQSYVEQRYGFRPKLINGDTPVQRKKARTVYAQNLEAESAHLDRLGICKDFNESVGFGVLILSPRAAGVGLTITGANHVIHFGRHWNPAKEDQATDRAYRIGQRRPVHVYLPKAVHAEYNSFDINIDKVLSRKRALASNVLCPTNFDSEGDILKQMLS